MKAYISIPHLAEWRKNEEITHLPLYLGVNISWDSHTFMHNNSREDFPRRNREGKHIFSITVGVMYWSIRFTLWKPGKFFFSDSTQQE